MRNAVKYALLLLIAATVLAILNTGASANGPSKTEKKAVSIEELLFTSGLERAGGHDELLDALLDYVKLHPEDPMTLVVLDRIGEIDNYCRDAYERVADVTREVYLPLLEPSDNPEAEKSELRIKNGHIFDRILPRLAWLHSREGDTDAADALYAKRGWITEWLAAGPFGAPEESNDHFLYMSYPPEKEIDLKKTYQRYRRSEDTAKWVKVEDDKGPNIGFRDDFEDDGCFYVLAQFYSDRERDLWLDYSVGDRYVIWFNGGEIVRGDPFEILRGPNGEDWFPQDRTIRVHVQEGWNNLLIKPSGRGVAARFLDDNAMPALGLRFEKEFIYRPARPAELRKGYKPEFMEMYPLCVFEDRLAKEKNNPYLNLIVSELFSRFDGDRSLTLAEAASSLLPQNADVTFYLSEKFNSVGHLPDGYARNKSKLYLDKTLALDENHILALFALSNYHLENDMAEEAYRVLQKAEKINPDFFPTFKELVDICQDMRWEGEERDYLDKMGDIWPDSPFLRNYWYSYYYRLGNFERVLSYIDKDLEEDYSERNIERKAGLFFRLGRYEEALDLYREIYRMNEDEEEYESNLEDIALARGDLAQVMRLWLKWFKEADEPHSYLKRRIADFRMKHDIDPVLARKAYDEVLAEDPGDSTLRRFLQYLDDVEEDFSEPYRLDVQTLIAESPSKEDFPESKVAYLADQIVIKFYHDLSYSMLGHVLRKLLVEEAKDIYGRLPRWGEVLEARTHLADGSTQEPLGYGWNYVMPGIDVGTTIEYRYRDDYRGGDPYAFATRNYFFCDTSFDGPYMQREIIAIIPRTVIDEGKMEILEANMPVEAERSEEGDDYIYRWRVENMEKYKRENAMPDLDKVLPNIRFVSRRTWKEMKGGIQRGWGTARGNNITKAVRDKAREITSRVNTAVGKFKVIYRWVNEAIKREGSNYHPHATLMEQAGDRSELIKAMAWAVGVKVRTCFVMPNPVFLDEIDWEYPEHNPFNGNLYYFKDETGGRHFFTADYRYAKFGEIQTWYYRGRALAFEPESGGLVEFPLPGDDWANHGGQRFSGNLDIAGDGSVSGLVKLYTPGLDGAGMGEGLAEMPEDRRVAIFSGLIAQLFPGARMTHLTIDNLRQPGEIPILNMDIRADKFINKLGEKLYMPLLIAQSGIGQLAVESERRFPLYLKGQMYYGEDDVTYNLPDGYEYVDIPEDLKIDWGSSSYALTYEVKGAKLTVKRKLRLAGLVVEPEAYPEFARRVADITRAESIKIYIRRVTE